MSQATVIMLLCLVMSLSSAYAAGEIKIRSDQNPVPINESFNLSFEASGDVDGDPDFSPLEENFDILGRSQHSNLQYINGVSSKTTSWILTMIAKKVGKVAIPAISFGSLSSAATHIVVTEERVAVNPGTQANPDLFVEVETDLTNPYIQAQVVLTIRFFRAINIATANMSSPTFVGGDVVVEQLGEGRSYKTNRDGRPHIVEERRYAIFPQESGNLTMEPIHVEVRVGGNNSIFGGMFNDPFRQQKSSIKRIRSQPLNFEVQPIPQNYTSDRWLPAHELILTEKWSKEPNKFIVGEPITRTITIMADGIPAKQLPESSNQDSSGLKQYLDRPEVVDQVETTGIIGMLKQKNAIIPTAAGNYTLPAFELPWWDVDENLLKVAKLPAITFTVSPAPNSQPAPIPPPPTTTCCHTGTDVSPPRE